MKLNIRRPIFKSKPSDDALYPCFFREPEKIQSALEKICESWAEYLQDYVERTSELFTNPELPWQDTERAVVSTLSASISRNFVKSILIEELRVTKSNGNGRCDLWASVPELFDNHEPFNFYLEAKTFLGKSGTAQVGNFLVNRGISRILSDYTKSSNGRIVKLSPYSKNKQRKHDHYIIGLLVTRIAPKSNLKQLDEELHNTFEKRLSVEIRSEKVIERPRHRRMARFPTVGLVVLPSDLKKPGMLATFTVIAHSGITKEQI